MKAKTWKRVALITGANKGIGFHIAEQMAKADSSLFVFSGARDPTRGNEAVAKLKGMGLSNVGFIQIDITDDEQVKEAASQIEGRFGGLDILVNNAGFAFKGDAFGEEVARTTISVNYYGTKRVLDAMFPLLRDYARVVNVGSFAGKLNKFSPELQDQFLAEDLTFEKLDALVEKFITGVKNSTYSEEGWPKTTYGVSKAAENQLGRLYTKKEEGTSRTGVVYNTMCPGWCRTDMAGDKAPRSAAEGAETAAWLALQDNGFTKTGAFWRDKEETPFV